MSAYISKICAVAACVGLAASAALADPSSGPSVANPYGQVDVAPGDVYVGAAGGVWWMTLPGWEYGVENTGADPLESKFEIEADGRLYGGQLWFGMAIDAGPGENTRIQLEGSYAEGDLDGRQFRPSPGANDVYILLGVSGGGVILEDSLATLDVDVRGWEVGMRALTDSLTGTSGAFTPSLMVFGGAATQDYDAIMIDLFPCPDCFENFARQDVDSWYVGVEAAVAGTVNLTPALTFTLGGRVAGLYFDADMDGEDCLDGEGGTPGCQPGGTSSVSDGLEEVTYRGGGFVGLNYDFGGASVGIMGTADYVPMADIVNPLDFSRPSHLDLSHELIYGGRGSIVIPFN
jgi:hypothetical protein